MTIAGLSLLRWTAEAKARLSGINCRRVLFFPQVPAIVLHLTGVHDRFLLLPNGAQIPAPCYFDDKQQLGILPGETVVTEKFNLLRSRRVVDISGMVGDRRVTLHFSPRPANDDPPVLMHIHLLGARTICILVDPVGRILATDRPAEKFPLGERYTPPTAPDLPALPVMVFPEFLSIWQVNEGLSSSEILRKKTWGVDEELAGMLLADIDQQQIRHAVDNQTLWQFFSSLKSRLREFLSPTTCLRIDPETGKMAGMAHEKDPVFGHSINELWRMRLAETIGEHRRHDARGIWRKFAETQLQRVHRAADTLHTRVAESNKAEMYKKYADTLGIHRHNLHKGLRQTEVADPVDDAKLLTIPLDPARSIQENIEEYYRKHRRALAAASALDEEKARLEAIATVAEEIIARTADSAQEDLPVSIEKWREELARLGLRPPESDIAPTHRKPARRLPYWEFTLSGGATILVGRSAKDNDELTLKRAAKTDWFLHAHQGKGAHVILRHPHATTPPEKSVLRQAAAAAAFFSESRYSAAVPVAYTPVKYVRKPRKAPPGLVSLIQEQTILVEPSPPPGYHAQ